MKTSLPICDEPLSIVVSKNCITVRDSWKISSRKKIRASIDELCAIAPDNAVIKNRSKKSLVNEWRFHNFLYKLRLLVSHTKDTDLNWPLTWYEKIVYTLFIF